MVINFIYSVLLLIAGSVIAALILLFGVKFCKDSGELSANPTWKDIFLQMLKGYPFWLWIIVFLAFQPAIIHILTTWFPSIWTTCNWVPSISDFIAFIVVGFFIILVKITDDNGRLRKFLKKSEWNLSKILLDSSICATFFSLRHNKLTSPIRAIENKIRTQRSKYYQNVG